MLTLTAVAAGMTVAACSPGGIGSGGGKCQVLVLEDTTEVYVSEGKVMAMAKRDTLPKPYAKCVTLYATVRDTLPKP
jgi:hypothetical protein